MQFYFPGELGKWLHPTVTHLTLQRNNIFFPEEGGGDGEFYGARMLGKMFPNVTSVAVISPHGQSELYRTRVLWHLCPPGVKRLGVTGLHIPVRNEGTTEAMNLIDSIFTRIPVEMCTELRKRPQRIDGDVLRTQRSICDLKHLEELNLSFNNLQPGRPFASHVTGLYASDLMPQLKVTFTYKPELSRHRTNHRSLQTNETPSEDMNSCLELIAPYVTQVCNHNYYYY